VAMLLAPDWLALAAAPPKLDDSKLAAAPKLADSKPWAPPKLDDEYEKDMFFFLCLRFKRKLFDFT